MPTYSPRPHTRRAEAGLAHRSLTLRAAVAGAALAQRSLGRAGGAEQRRGKNKGKKKSDGARGGGGRRELIRRRRWVRYEQREPPRETGLRMRRKAGRGSLQPNPEALAGDVGPAAVNPAGVRPRDSSCTARFDDGWARWGRRGMARWGGDGPPR